MSERILKSEEKSSVETTMYYRLNRYTRIKKFNRGVQFSGIFGISGLLIVFFIVIIIIGSTPTLKEAVNETMDEVWGEEKDGSYASDITFKTIDGESIRLADHQGEVVIVFFFGTHCPGCPDQADILGDIDNDYSSSELFIVPVCLDSEGETSDSELRSFLDDRQIKWPAIRDTPQYTYATYFDIKYKPTVKVLDKDGNVEDTMVGIEEGSYDNIKDEVDSLL